jgi:predicted permease
MTELYRRLCYLLNRRRIERELIDEMAFHREMAARGGGRPFGNMLRLREEAREAWGWTWIDRLAQDLRYAFRMLRRSPGFTAVAILMLAIGIGVNVAVFGFLNAVMFSPLPVRDPGTLLRFERRAPQGFASELPYPEVVFLRQHARSLAAVLAAKVGRLRIDEDPTPLQAHFVTPNFFRELGAAPKLGRLLDPDQDKQLQADPAVVLSEGFWVRRFGADPTVVGRTVHLGGKTVTVVGVAPIAFSGLTLDSPDVWLPIGAHPYIVEGSRLLTDFSPKFSSVKMWGRLRPGVAPAQAETELRSLLAELRKQYPHGIWEDESLASRPGGYAQLGGGSHSGTGAPPPANQLYSRMVVTGALVLLILAVACSNLGSLLLARGVARGREISIRVAVGAGSARLIRQLFTESLVLAFLGAVVGTILGYVVLRLILAETGAPPWLNPAPDWRVILFAIGLTFVAATLFGLAPALQTVRQHHRAKLIRQLLIGAQIAASCVLLIVAGLLLRAVDHVQSVHPGFEFRRVVSINPGLASHGHSPAQAGAYLEMLQSRLLALPGVESIALASTPPLGGMKTILAVRGDDYQVDAHINHVDPAFLSTMSIPLLRGRNLARGDTRAVVVSDSLARLAWPGEDPLGKHIAENTVVGVSGSARVVALEDPDAVEIYRPIEPSDFPSMMVLVRTSGEPEGIAPVLASTARAIDRRVFPQVELLSERFRGKLREAEYTAVGVTLLGGSALLLACLGIVGLVAYAVTQRTKEIGIRMALGAQPRDVVTSILRQFARPVFGGLVLGVGGAAVISQLLRRELFGISHLDPVAYLSVVGLFLVVVILAGMAPARRALRIDPLQALRRE